MAVWSYDTEAFTEENCESERNTKIRRTRFHIVKLNKDMAMTITMTMNMNECKAC